MADAGHDRKAGAGNFLGNRFRHRRRAGIVVFASEQRDLASAGVDLAQVLTGIPIVAVKMDVALIDTRSRLAVIPPVLAPVFFRTERRAQSVCIACAKLAPVNRRVMQELAVAAGRIGRTLQTDDAAQLVLMLSGELEHDSAAHRASHDYGLLDLERLPDRADDTEIGFGREPIPHQPPVGGWVRPAVPRQIERNDPESARHIGIVKHMTELAAVGAGGMQA
jgi:hypothetical protein